MGDTDINNNVKQILNFCFTEQGLQNSKRDQQRTENHSAIQKCFLLSLPVYYGRNGNTKLSIKVLRKGSKNYELITKASYKKKILVSLSILSKKIYIQSLQRKGYKSLSTEKCSLKSLT